MRSPTADRKPTIIAPWLPQPTLRLRGLAVKDVGQIAPWHRAQGELQGLTALGVLLALMCAWPAWQAGRAHRVAACYREVMATMEAPPEGDCDRL